jgi:hypothetical protein
LVARRGGWAGGCSGFGACAVTRCGWRAVDVRGAGTDGAEDDVVVVVKDGSVTEEGSGSAAAGAGSGWANKIPNSADAAVAAPAASQVVDRIRRRVSATVSASRSSGGGRVTPPSLDAVLWRFLRVDPRLRQLTASSATMGP